jgi:hypothetical protein
MSSIATAEAAAVRPRSLLLRYGEAYMIRGIAGRRPGGRSRIGHGDGQRYAVDTAAVEVDTNPGLNGSVVGQVHGGAWRGRSVKIPRGTLIGFRLQRALMMGVADRGVTRDGKHYHDYYKRDRE